MNPTLMMMAMSNQKKRPAPTDRITNRPTKAQVAWIKAIEEDSTKEVIHVSEGSPVSLSVEILDHSLSLAFAGPVVVTVVLDLLANEKSIEVVKSGVDGRRLITWQQKPDGIQQTNCWAQKYPSPQATLRYWDNKSFYWEEKNAFTCPADNLVHKVALALFNSATDGGSAGYRGSRVTNASLAKISA